MISTKWARNVLRLLDWVKRRGTTAKLEMNPALYEELIFSWKRKKVEIVLEHNIHEKMILNFDQTPVGFTSQNHSSQRVFIPLFK